MRKLDRLILRLGVGLSWGFLVIVALITYEVIARYGFNAPTFWAHEISGVLAAIAFIFGGAYCMVERSHLRITLWADGASSRWKTAAELIGLLCGAVYLGGMAIAMWSISEKSLFRFMPDGAWMPERSGTSWNTPAPAFIKFALLLGSALFLLVTLSHIWRLLRGRRDGDGPADRP